VHATGLITICSIRPSTASTKREKEREREKGRTTEKERCKKERGRNGRGWTRWEEDTCDFIRHPYSNEYSITCACWLRYAFAPTRGRCWSLVLVRVSSHACVRPRPSMRICVRRERARSMRELNTRLSVA
jgi:hypothetical protein